MRSDLMRVPPWWLLACLLAVACGGGEPEASATSDEVGSVAAAEGTGAAETTVAGVHRFLPDEMLRETRPEAFAHDVHSEIVCSVCHERVPGHTSHAELACGECHRASEGATLRSLSRDDCLACHHSRERNLECAACHETWGQVLTTQTLDLEVWAAPRTRAIPFDHGIHQDLECASCHAELPTLAPVPCATCHEDHHAPAVRCITCHVQASEGAHDLEVHRTCSGSGCHRERSVELLASTRPVCLVCHQAQETHEPDGDCVDCHQVRSDFSSHMASEPAPVGSTVLPRGGGR